MTIEELQSLTQRVQLSAVIEFDGVLVEITADEINFRRPWVGFEDAGDLLASFDRSTFNDIVAALELVPQR